MANTFEASELVRYMDDADFVAVVFDPLDGYFKGQLEDYRFHPLPYTDPIAECFEAIQSDLAGVRHIVRVSSDDEILDAVDIENVEDPLIITAVEPQ